MNKSHNKGLSFVEIALSVVIFGILMTPIVSKLITATRSADQAKDAQSRYEMAENLMENVKNADSFLPDTAVDSQYLKDISTSGSIGKLPNSGLEALTDASSGVSYNAYIVYGKTKIGKKDTEYNYAISLDTYDYAFKEKAGLTPTGEKTYNNPNTMTLATIEDLDTNRVALINGTIGNYDMTVNKAFMSKKLDVLKIGDKARWEQYTKQQADIVAFPNDTVKRCIQISVADEKNNVPDPVTHQVVQRIDYTVTCKLVYKEQSSTVLKSGKYAGKTMGSLLDPIEYIPYQQTFEGELPNIYLMYNPCLYNNNYMPDDYIMLDTTGLTVSDPDVNLFVIETAEKFAADAAVAYEDSFKEVYKEKTGTDYTEDINAADANLINTDVIRDREDVVVKIFGRDVGVLPQITIYSNLLIPDASGNLPNIVNKKNGTFTLIDSAPFDASSDDYAFSAGQIKPLSAAVDAAASLYKVKVYITKDALDTSSYSNLATQLSNMTPTITGSKGGNQ